MLTNWNNMAFAKGNATTRQFPPQFVRALRTRQMSLTLDRDCNSLTTFRVLTRQAAPVRAAEAAGATYARRPPGPLGKILRQPCRVSLLEVRGEIESAQVQAREIPLTDKPEDVGTQQLAVSTRGVVGRQHPVVDPALDGGGTYTQCLRYIGRTVKLRFCHTDLSKRIKSSG